jgi:hypothetical protein
MVRVCGGHRYHRYHLRVFTDRGTQAGAGVVLLSDPVRGRASADRRLHHHRPWGIYAEQADLREEDHLIVKLREILDFLNVLPVKPGFIQKNKNLACFKEKINI